MMKAISRSPSPWCNRSCITERSVLRDEFLTAGRRISRCESSKDSSTKFQYREGEETRAKIRTRSIHSRVCRALKLEARPRLLRCTHSSRRRQWFSSTSPGRKLFCNATRKLPYRLTWGKIIIRWRWNGKSS